MVICSIFEVTASTFPLVAPSIDIWWAGGTGEGASDVVGVTVAVEVAVAEGVMREEVKGKFD